jgi:hypothetical protein
LSKLMLEKLGLEAKSPTAGFILVRLCARLIHWPFDFHEWNSPPVRQNK